MRAFQADPETVPLGWLGAGAAALLIFWAGWRLSAAGRRAAQSNRPASLGVRLARRWRGTGAGEEEPARRE